MGFVDTNDPRYFNRYSYSGNDPVNNTDPDGRCFTVTCHVLNLDGGVKNSQGQVVYKRGTSIAAGLAVAGPPLDLATDLAPGISSIKGAAELGASPSAMGVLGVLPGGKQAEKAHDAQKIFRRGTSKESSARLDRLSKQADDAGFGHGVSGSKTPLGSDDVSATVGDLKDSGFGVRSTPTRNNPDHVTIDLPNPVTKEDAAKFNKCFGRDNC